MLSKRDYGPRVAETVEAPPQPGRTSALVCVYGRDDVILYNQRHGIRDVAVPASKVAKVRGWDADQGENGVYVTVGVVSGVGSFLRFDIVEGDVGGVVGEVLVLGFDL